MLSAAPASASSTWYVVVGYTNPQLIAGPYDSLPDCNRAASDYSARNSYNSAFHCEYRYSPGSSSEQNSRVNDNGDSGSTSYYRTRYNLVYHAATHDRVVSSGYTSFSACSLEAGHDNLENDDYRYGCTIALP